MKNNRLNIKSSMAGLLLLLFVSSCEHKNVIYTIEGYDISKPEKIKLGSKLDEISGIFWVNDSTIIANNDEGGKIFAINLLDKTDFNYRNIRFGEKGDYEDIVKVEDTIFLLLATGSIIKVTGYKSEETIQSAEIAVVPGKHNEFETMYYDQDIHSLILLCKECHKEKDQVRTAFRYDLNTQKLDDTPYYKIDINAIKALLKSDREQFKPTSAAIHPLQQKLYIVAAVGHSIVVADKKGNVEQAIPISPRMFPQPEGLTFASNGDMYISNEVATEDRATLLRFPFKKK